MSTKKKAKVMRPCDVSTFEQIYSLKGDNVSTKKSWILVDEPGTVCIFNQESGKKSTGHVGLTKAEFKKFAEWYFGVKIV